MASGRMLLRLGVVLCLGAAVAASPIDLEDVAAAQAAQARDGLPERLEPLVTSVENEQAFEEFIQLHKPSLGKVLFFSKLGVSELCESLAEHFDGQLDVLHISPNATDVAAKFQNEELPAVYYMPPQVSNQGDSATLQLLKYEGNFKFGALDRIVNFLDEFAPPVPSLPVISSQAGFEEHCRGPLPCLVLFLQGDGDVHSPDLVSKVAKLYAGDRVVVVVVDIERWRAPLIQLQAQAPTALFIGPFGSEGSFVANRMPNLGPSQEFAPFLVEYFLYESRKMAGIAVDKGFVDEDSGLTELTQLPDIAGKHAPRKRKGRKARRQAKLQADGATATGSGDIDLGNVEDESWLEL